MSAGPSGAGSSDGRIHSFLSMDDPEPTIEIMEKDLLCPVCFSLFDEPQVLRCAHSFCQTCLDGVIQISAATTANATATPSSITCPVCRMETSLTGPDGPKDNFVLRGIVGKYKQIRASQKNSTCEVHAMQPLNLYCSTDHKLICGVCATSKRHKGHVFSSLPNASNQEKIVLEELIQELENRPELLTTINTLKADRDRALQERSDLKDQISAYIGNLHHILDQWQNQMISDLDARMASLTRQYNVELYRITRVHNQQRDALEMARGLRDASEPLHFLREMREVRENVSLRQETPRPTVTEPTDSRSLRNFDVRTWDSIRLADVHTIRLPAQDLQRPRRQPITMSNSIWLCPALVLLSMLIMATFFAITLYRPGKHIRSGLVTEKAGDPGLSNWYLTLNKIAVLIERYQDLNEWLMSRAAEYVNSMIWRRGMKKEILQLGWEKKDTPTPSIIKTTGKPEQTGQLYPTPSSNTREMAYATMSNTQDLQKTRPAERDLALHQRGHVLLSYMSTAIRKAAERVSDYWWIMVKEIHHLGGRCHTYIQEFAHLLYDLA